MGYYNLTETKYNFVYYQVINNLLWKKAKSLEDIKYHEPGFGFKDEAYFTEEEMIHRFFGNANLTYEELDLYGVWETRFYMVTIYQNNETQGYVRPMEYGEQLFFYAEKSGYILEGWYLDENLTTEINESLFERDTLLFKVGVNHRTRFYPRIALQFPHLCKVSLQESKQNGIKQHPT